MGIPNNLYALKLPNMHLSYMHLKVNMHLSDMHFWIPNNFLLLFNSVFFRVFTQQIIL
jgi:hypothetical protein